MSEDQGKRKAPDTFSKDEAAKIRDMLGQESGQFACPRCGAELFVSAPVAGGGSVGPVWEVWCDNCSGAALLTELPGGRALLTNRELARRMPDEFAQMDTLPRYRVTKLVTRYWIGRPLDARRALTEQLLAALEPIAAGQARVTEAIRDRCETIVMQWIEELDR